MVLHGLKRIFQKPSPELTSSERTNQLRSKTIYSGTVELSHELTKPGSNRYKTYNGPFEVVNKNGNGSLVASASYRDLLDITKGKVLLNQLPLNDLTYPYYEKNFGNGEIYVGNYQQFDGSFFNGSGPTGCADSVLIYDISTTGFTGPGSYNGNSIGNTGPSGTVGSNQDIFIDPKHCYYSDPCNSNNSYMKFVDINFKGPTGITGITGPSQYYAQQIINGNQYNGFRFPMSNFTLTCKQLNLSQTEGPIFCPLEPPSLSNFNIPPQIYSPVPFSISIPPPQSNSLGAFTYSSSNHSVAVISGPNLDMITIVGEGISTITALQAASGIYSSGSISTFVAVIPLTTTVYDWNSLATTQHRAFTINVTTSLQIGLPITITYSGTDSITGNIISIIGTTVTIKITALTHAAYVSANLISTLPPFNYDYPSINPILPYVNTSTSPNPPEIAANSIITNGECYIYYVTVPGIFTINLSGTSIQRGVSSSETLLLMPSFAPGPPPTPTVIKWNGSNGGCFVGVSQQVVISATSTSSLGTGMVTGIPFIQPYWCGFIQGYTLTYSTGVISI